MYIIRRNISLLYQNYTGLCFYLQVRILQISCFAVIVVIYWMLNKYRLLLELRGYYMRLYLCMQTWPINRNQIARGFVLTWPGLLVVFVTIVRWMRYLNLCNRVLRITENCYAWQRKRRARLTDRSSHKRMQKYPLLLFCHHCRRCISRCWTSRHFYIRRMELAYIYHSLYCNTNLLYPRHIFVIRQSRNKILENNLYDLTYLFQLHELFLLLFIPRYKLQRASQSSFL